MARRLLQLNGLAILAVVVNHATGWVFTAMFWWAHRFRPVESPNFDQVGSWDYYGMLGIMQLTVFAVPAFLFVTGYFLAYAARGSRSSLNYKIVGGRLVTILIPYLFWSLVIFASDILQGEIMPPLEYLYRLIMGKATAAYFYIPLLAQFLVLSPLLAPLAKTSWKPLLIVSVVVQAFLISFFYLNLLDVPLPLQDLVIISHFPFFGRRMVYFSLGIIAGFHQQSIRLFLARFKLVLLVAVIIMAFMSVVESLILSDYTSGRGWSGPQTITSHGYAIFFILCFLAFERLRFPFPKFFEWLGRNSLGIYLMHVIVLEFVSRSIAHLSPCLLGCAWLFQFSLVVLAIALPLALMQAVKISPVRCSYRYLFG
jgi:peptidoglycan/LPS O-acetylase OafA/YrhL